jgi:hypothetical protein
MGALPLFESHDAPLPDGPARERLVKEGDASEVKMRTVAARADGIRVLDRPGVMDRRKRRGVEGHAAQRGKGEGAAGYACKLLTPPWWMREKAHVVEPRKLRSHCSRDLLGKRKHPAGVKPGRRFLGSVDAAHETGRSPLGPSKALSERGEIQCVTAGETAQGERADA